MKRIIWLIWMSILPFFCNGQDVKEYIRVITDRELYITGEDLHISILVEDEQHQPLDMSKVAYVEICDTKVAHVQFMVALENGRGWGSVIIPPSMHSGTYELSVYTRYMRNYNPACFYRQNLGVVNLSHKSPEDNLVWEERLIDLPYLPSSIHTDKAVYNQRSLVQVNLPEDYQGQAALSVRRLDMNGSPETESMRVQTYKGKSSGDYLPELEGHLLSVQGNGNLNSLRDAQLGVMGLSAYVADGYQSKGQEFLFPMIGIYGHQFIAMAGRNAQDRPVPVVLNSPYANSLPAELPTLRIRYEDIPLKYRLLASQLRNNLITRNEFTQKFTLEGREPNYIYNLSEYTPMQSIREALVEFIEGIKSDRYKGHPALFTTSEEYIGFCSHPALVLLDGVPVQDIEKLLAYDARRIHYILIYRGKYTFGNSIQEGVISFTTYNGKLPGYQLTEEERLYEYDFPQNRPSFHTIEYSSAQALPLEKPDFRSLLYWNPQVKEKSISFYTSDMIGKYEIVLTTFNSSGKLETDTCYIEVK